MISGVCQSIQHADRVGAAFLNLPGLECKHTRAARIAMMRTVVVAFVIRNRQRGADREYPVRAGRSAVGAYRALHQTRMMRTSDAVARPGA